MELPCIATARSRSFSQVLAHPVPGQSLGIAFGGLSGPAAIPFGTQGGFVWLTICDWIPPCTPHSCGG